MVGLSDVRPQIDWDEDAERIIALATASADRLIRTLLIESITSWAAEGFNRFDDHEISFTIRLYACMLKVKDSNRGKMLMMHPQYEAQLPSQDMLLGIANPAKSPRPDLNVKCGEATIYLEAKRVMPTGDLPAEYVDNGMMRFLDGRYVSPGVNLDFMLGYVLQGTTAECYEAINDVIRVRPSLGPDEIAKQGEVMEGINIYASEHQAGEIIHYAIDVRVRQPSWQQSHGMGAKQT